MMNIGSTICAVATAQGGAISVIRISGPQAIQVTDRIFKPVKGMPFSERAPYSVSYGRIIDSEGSVVDEVVTTLYRAPKSYTGEDCTEIACHGSTYIANRILALLIEAGCCMAQPGEFTQRAFLNGKMDLSQAEAVADLIASTSAATHRLAMNQMRGGFSKELSGLRDRLLHLTSLMELELDFSDHEELEFADRSELQQIAMEIEQVISRLANSFSVGNAIKNGVPVAIIGETNVGKSTLLNALLNEDKAIVSDIHGTTRDVIEDTIIIGGTMFRFIDTAGIRQTDDVVESIGIERTFQKLEQASIVLWLIDTPALSVSANSANTLYKNDYIGHSEGADCFIESSNNGLGAIGKCLGESENSSYGLENGSSDSGNGSNGSNDDLSNLEVWEHLKAEILPHCSGKQLIILFNKCDRITESELSTVMSMFENIDAHKLAISAKNGLNIDKLHSLLVECAALPQISQGDVIVTNARHYEALVRALDSIHRVQDGLQMNLSGDFVSQDLRECIHHLSDIVGDVTTDQVLANIFHHFCIGK
jgi:tRNA modification GTPase